MKSTIRFTSGSTTIDVNGPDGSTQVRCQPNWVQALSEGLIRFSYRTTNRHLELWTLRLDSLTLAMKRNLLSFFYATAQGPTNAFTYRHTDEVTYSGVRFAQTDLQFERRNDQDWSVTIILEIGATVSAGVNQGS